MEFSKTEPDVFKVVYFLSVLTISRREADSSRIVNWSFLFIFLIIILFFFHPFDRYVLRIFTKDLPIMSLTVNTVINRCECCPHGGWNFLRKQLKEHYEKCQDANWFLPMKYSLTLSVFIKHFALNKCASNELSSPGLLINDQNIGSTHTLIFKKNCNKDCGPSI